METYRRFLKYLVREPRAKVVLVTIQQWQIQFNTSVQIFRTNWFRSQFPSKPLFGSGEGLRDTQITPV